MEEVQRRIEFRLTELGIELPKSPSANGNYETWVLDQGIFATSGQLSRVGENVIEGQLNQGDNLDEARHAARVCILRCLSVAQRALGSLDRIERIITIRGFISASPNFTEHSAVLDGASDLLIEIFGDRGPHIRTSVGVASLPAGGLVEIELTARVAQTV